MRYWLFIPLSALIAASLTLYWFSLRLQRRLPPAHDISLDGITSISDAVDACKHSELTGWPLVEYAQKLAAHKFTYSRLNPWDSPSQAFERGIGYCQQQALALKAIYAGLGIDAKPVFAARCAFPAKVVDGASVPEGISGHTWLRVKVDGEERDVCSGSQDNTPGRVHFVVLSTVRPLYSVIARLHTSSRSLRTSAVIGRINGETR